MEKDIRTASSNALGCLHGQLDAHFDERKDSEDRRDTRGLLDGRLAATPSNLRAIRRTRRERGRAINQDVSRERARGNPRKKRTSRVDGPTAPGPGPGRTNPGFGQ